MNLPNPTTTDALDEMVIHEDGAKYFVFTVQDHEELASRCQLEDAIDAAAGLGDAYVALNKGDQVLWTPSELFIVANERDVRLTGLSRYGAHGWQWRTDTGENGALDYWRTDEDGHGLCLNEMWDKRRFVVDLAEACIGDPEHGAIRPLRIFPQPLQQVSQPAPCRRRPVCPPGGQRRTFPHEHHHITPEPNGGGRQRRRCRIVQSGLPR